MTMTTRGPVNQDGTPAPENLAAHSAGCRCSVCSMRAGALPAGADAGEVDMGVGILKQAGVNTGDTNGDDFDPE